MTTTHRDPQSAQLWLPGQAGAPDGPVDMFMMYVMHHAFRRDLADFAAAVPVTPVEDRATWQALHERWIAFGEILHNHHSGEDAGLWPLLLSKVDEDGDGAGRATLEAMEAEHEQIDPLLESCGAGFVAMAAGGSAAERAALSVRVTATREALGRHLAHEETDAMAILQEQLTAAEWEETEQKFFRSKLDLRALRFSVPWAVFGVPADKRRQTFPKLPAMFRVVWLLTRRGFDRRQRAAFRYAAG